MSNAVHVPVAASFRFAGPEAGWASRPHDESVGAAPMAQQTPPAPPAPRAPATPRLDGMPPEAREAIANAIREAQAAAAQARAEARAAQEQVRVDVDGQRVIVTPGGAVGGGGGQGGEHIVIQDPHPFPDVPPRLYDLAIPFFFTVAFIAVGTAIARAFGRARAPHQVQAAPSPELSAQLQRIEHAVEAMAIEVERISEAQRYMARLESERGADPALLARPGRRE